MADICMHDGRIGKLRRLKKTSTNNKLYVVK